MNLAVLIVCGIVAVAFISALAVFFGCVVYDAVSYAFGRRRVVRQAERALSMARHPAGKRRR